MNRVFQQFQLAYGHRVTVRGTICHVADAAEIVRSPYRNICHRRCQFRQIAFPLWSLYSGGTGTDGNISIFCNGIVTKSNAVGTIRCISLNTGHRIFTKRHGIRPIRFGIASYSRRIAYGFGIGPDGCRVLNRRNGSILGIIIGLITNGNVISILRINVSSLGFKPLPCFTADSHVIIAVHILPRFAPDSHVIRTDYTLSGFYTDSN